jgi:hypothetical protein
MANMEKKFLRLTFWQTVLSVAGVFTGAVALYAALTESQAVREQTAAAVWPYVQLMINDTYDGETASFSLTVENVGVGPARMQGATVMLGGSPVRDWQSLTDALVPEGVSLGVDYGKSNMTNRVIAPGDSIVAFETYQTDLALKIQNAVSTGSLTVSYCYCSIFDECWMKPESSTEGDMQVQAVSACPISAGIRFVD